MAFVTFAASGTDQNTNHQLDRQDTLTWRQTAGRILNLGLKILGWGLLTPSILIGIDTPIKNAYQAWNQIGQEIVYAKIHSLKSEYPEVSFVTPGGEFIHDDIDPIKMVPYITAAKEAKKEFVVIPVIAGTQMEYVRINLEQQTLTKSNDDLASLKEFSERLQGVLEGFNANQYDLALMPAGFYEAIRAALGKETIS